MWDILANVAWVIAAAIFLWMAWDFFVINAKYDDDKRRFVEISKRGR